VNLSQRLYEVHEDKLYEELGHESFNDYAEERLGVQKRKALYLVSIWRSIIVKAGMPVKDLRRIPWAKAKEIARVIDEENKEKWTSLARTNSLRDLTTEVQKITSKVKGKDQEEMIRKVFVLPADVALVLEEALGIAGELSKSDSSGRQLEVILMEFMAHHAKGQPEARLQHYLKLIGGMFTVDVVAFKTGTQEAIAHSGAKE